MSHRSTSSIKSTNSLRSRLSILNTDNTRSVTTEQNRLRVVVLAELSRIRWTWQNLVEVADVTDIVDIAVEIGRQNMAEI